MYLNKDSSLPKKSQKVPFTHYMNVMSESDSIELFWIVKSYSSSQTYPCISSWGPF